MIPVNRARKFKLLVDFIGRSTTQRQTGADITILNLLLILIRPTAIHGKLQYVGRK